MRCGGREQSILELLQEIKENLLLENRAGQKSKEIKGKHSGSRNLPLEEKTELQMSDVNLAATIRANSGYFRTGRENIDSLEIRLKRYRRKQQMSILFVVDASRSQGNRERLAFVKGAVLEILKKAYTECSKAGVIVFGNKQAQVALPFTKSVEFAAKQMEQLTAKGNTPLAEGIRLAVTTLIQEKRKYPESLQMMVLLTDGKCNYDSKEGTPFKLALNEAGELKRNHLPVLVVDTENSVFGMGLAKKIAKAAGGKYVEMV